MAEEDVIDGMPAELSPEMKAAVMKVYTIFDAKGTGKVPLDSLDSGNIEIGPMKNNVLKVMKDMDANGDGFIEPDEWEFYFRVVAEALSPEELSNTLKDLEAAGMCAQSCMPPQLRAR